jgi:hypothetical protein
MREHFADGRPKTRESFEDPSKFHRISFEHPSKHDLRNRLVARLQPAGKTHHCRFAEACDFRLTTHPLARLDNAYPLRLHWP